MRATREKLTNDRQGEPEQKKYSEAAFIFRHSKCLQRSQQITFLFSPKGSGQIKNYRRMYRKY
jgi:hypothetical protein